MHSRYFRWPPTNRSPRYVGILVLITGYLAAGISSGQMPVDAQRIPFAKNAYIEPHEQGNRYGQVSDDGIGGWTDADSLIKVYFLALERGPLTIELNVKSPSSTSTLQVDCADQQFMVDVPKSADYVDIPVGAVTVAKAGYQLVTIKGIKKSGSAYFPDLRELVLSGPAADGVRYNLSRWRNAPSTHLWYETPGNVDIDTFYSELTIPEGADPIASYYVANGFSTGYFGIQVNSETERRVLFSIWSSFATDDPGKIPEDQRVILLKKGPDVVTNDFGNEGSGGQSFLRFDWKTGVTYKFVVQATRNESDKSNTYTARFFAPEVGQWRLIASWKQQKSETRFLQGLYSFVENFGPATGHRLFRGNFANQWVRATNGQLGQLTRATFTTTADPGKHPRFDYGAGVKGDQFYMFSGGFQSNRPPKKDARFTRRPGPRPSFN